MQHFGSVPEDLQEPTQHCSPPPCSLAANSEMSDRVIESTKCFPPCLLWREKKCSLIYDALAFRLLLLHLLQCYTLYMTKAVRQAILLIHDIKTKRHTHMLSIRSKHTSYTGRHFPNREVRGKHSFSPSVLWSWVLIQEEKWQPWVHLAYLLYC